MCVGTKARRGHHNPYHIPCSWSYGHWRLRAENFSPLGEQEEFLLLSHLSCPSWTWVVWICSVCVCMCISQRLGTSSISFHIEPGWSSPNFARVAGQWVQGSLLRHPNVKITDVLLPFETLCVSLHVMCVPSPCLASSGQRKVSDLELFSFESPLWVLVFLTTEPSNSQASF